MSEFEPSKLGTKDHWDKFYEEEILNLDELEEEGEIWFGKESMEKMVDWTVANAPHPQKILEVGTGNGVLLCELAKQGYDPTNLLGIDYSAGSIALSQKIAQHREVGQISFEVLNFLTQDPSCLPGMQQAIGSWDLLLDKGTYDAIALAEKDTTGVAPVDLYPGRVVRLLRPGGLFLITSCNFTEDELKQKFANPKTGLEYHSRIRHQTFTFGGKTGSVCSSVAFRKPIADT